MYRLILALTIAALAAPLPGCKPPGSADPGHTEAEDEHAGHDHGAEGEDAHADEVVLTPAAIEQNGVAVAEAQLWQLRPTFVAPARVAFNAEAMAHVGSPLPGRVVELHARVGDQVQARTPLMIVESPELGVAQSDFLVKRTLAETASPAVDLAKAAFDRAKALHESPEGITMTLNEVQKREAEHREALAALKSAQVEAQAAENHLHLLGMTQEQVDALAVSGEVNPRFTIAAPIAGRIVQREVTLGELVSPEREALLVIADMTTLWVLADVPEARLHEVGVGSKAWIRIGGVQSSQFEGAVAFISAMVDASTRTAQVRIEVKQDAARGDGASDVADSSAIVSAAPLKPGMFAQVEIVAAAPGGQEPEPVVAVPEAAIQTVEGGPAVFVPVPEEANTFAKRAVVIGKAVGGLVPIYSGLVEGERFVSAGSFILKAELGKSSAGHGH